jgi:sulfonate transport system substrate-binding protein
MPSRLIPKAHGVALSGLIAALLILLPATAHAQITELRIGVQYGLGNLPLYVARDAGLFDKHMQVQGLGSVAVRIVQFAGGPQIQDGLLSRALEVGAGDQEVLGLTLLSSVPYVWTVGPRPKTLRDLDAQKDKNGLPAIKVFVPAIFLQMASEQLNGIGKHTSFDPMTVSLAQPEDVISLMAGGDTVGSYLLAPPFGQQTCERPNPQRAWASNKLFGSPIIALATWTTARFRRETPKHVVAFAAAIREAVERIHTNKSQAAAIYVKAEPSKLPPEYFAKRLQELEVRFSLAPENSLKIAEYLARVGVLKHKPNDWKDYYFPELYGENGS